MQILTILRSLVPREAGRLDLALARGVFLAAASLIFLPAAWLNLNWPPTGPTLHAALSVLSLLLAVFLAARLGGDGVGDVRSGLLPLLFLTGVQPRQWLAVRLLQVWAGFASVWIVRVPLLVFTISLGGVSVARVLAMEWLLLVAFLFASSFGLLGSFIAKSRQQMYSTVVLPLIGWEILLITPGFFAAVMARSYGWPISTGTRETLDAIGQMGLVSRSWAALSGTLSLSQFALTFAMYALWAALVLVRFVRVTSAVSRGDAALSAGDPPHTAQPKGRAQRQSRRCWDDALAWQAYAIHGYGVTAVKAKGILAAVGGLAVLLSIPLGYFELVFGLTAFLCAIVLLNSVNKPSDCLAREIREETLPVLLLTPHGMADYYAGWQRGALRLAWPEIALAAVLACAAFRLEPTAPAGVISVAAAILLSGPFLMLSPLVPWTFSGIATGLAVTFAATVIVGAAIVCGAALHPFAAPAVLIPLAWLFNFLLRRFLLPHWMQAKISSIV